MEFARQYAMIVLSILTALGLEHVAISIHDAGAAHASRTRIEAELAGNVSDLRQALQANTANAQKVKDLFKALTEQLKAGKPIDARTEALMQPAFGSFEISLPSWQRSAWDCAIADQSASHLPAADLRRYAEIYATAGGMGTAEQLLLGGEWLTRASDLQVDIRLGRINPATLAPTLARFLLASQQISGNEAALEALITTGHRAEPAQPGPVK